MKKDEEDYMSASKSTLQPPPQSSTPGSSGSSRAQSPMPLSSSKAPPSASGPVLSDMLPNVRSKMSKSSRQTGSSSGQSKGGTALTTNDISDLTAAIAALEVSTNLPTRFPFHLMTPPSSEVTLPMPKTQSDSTQQRSPRTHKARQTPTTLARLLTSCVPCKHLTAEALQSIALATMLLVLVQMLVSRLPWTSVAASKKFAGCCIVRARAVAAILVRCRPSWSRRLNRLIL